LIARLDGKLPIDLLVATRRMEIWHLLQKMLWP